MQPKSLLSAFAVLVICLITLQFALTKQKGHSPFFYHHLEIEPRHSQVAETKTAE